MTGRRWRETWERQGRAGAGYNRSSAGREQLNECRGIFQGGGLAGAPVWVGNVGGVAENGAGAELLRPWGSATDYREAAAERVGWKMALSLTGGSHEGSGVHRRQDVHNQKVEHGRAIHCNSTASVPLQGDGAARGVRVIMRWWDQKGIDW